MKSFPWANLPLQKFKTSDNATLFYYKRCAKCECKGTLLFLMGWTQGPNNWSPVLLTNNYIIKYYDVYVLTMRGYNNFNNNFNNYIARYSQDVVEFINCNKITKITPITHSMGCSVIWYLIGLYGEKLFNSYIFVDQPIQVLVNPAYTPEKNLQLGSIFTTDALFGFYNGCAVGPNESTVIRTAFEQSCFTPEFIAQQPEIYAKAVEGMLKYNYKVVNEVLFNHACNNYDQVLSKGLHKPALLIGGRVSIVPWQTVVNQKKFYKNATVKIFEANQGGSHSMYLENYSLFNKYVNKFLSKN
jgi:pimeloyl-ACP methyl ester carboxylesterase